MSSSTSMAPGAAGRVSVDPLGAAVPAPSAALKAFGAMSAVSAPRAATGPAARGGYAGLDDRRARRATREAFRGFVDSKGWADLADQPGLDVRRYVGERSAVVTLAGRRSLVTSMLPLRAGAGKDKRPLDTRLSVQHGRLRPARTLSAYSIATTSRGGSLVDFPRSGVKIALGGAGGRGARGAREGQSLVYPNAYRDADVVLKSLPAAVQFAVSVRGPQAPERYPLALDLRAGDRLVATSPGAAAPIQGPDGGVVVLRGGRAVTSISAPVAADADGKALPVTTRIVDSRVVYGLAHRSTPMRYPALLDPVVSEDQRYWFGQPPAPTPPSPNPVPDFGGWAFSSTPALLGGIAGSGAFGNGLNIFASASITYPAAGTVGSWIFQAPYVPAFEADGARITKADFGYTAHTRSQGASSAMLQSIYNRQAGRTENGFVRGADPNGSYSAYPDTIFGFSVANSEGIAGNKVSYPYRVHCLSVCNLTSPGGNETLGSPGNQVRLSMLQTGGRPTLAGGVFMGSSLILMTEQAPPRITTTGAPAPTTWTKNPFTLTATVNDYGLGARDASMTAPGASGLPSAVQGGACTAGAGPPQGGTPGSANQGDRNHRCTTPLTLQTGSGNLADGSYNIAVNATDILNNPGTANLPVKLDRQAPTISPSGTLNDARNGFIGPNQDYTLSVTATDGTLTPATAQRSGVTSLTATLDGQPMTSGSATAPCTRPEGSCSLTINATLSGEQVAELDDAVPHTIKIEATDALGQTQTETFTFRVDLIDPSLTALDGTLGDLADLEPRPLRENDYDLIAEARDNLAENNEEEDLDGDVMPQPVPLGSGLLNIVIRLDGEAVASVSADCAAGAQCEKRQTWEWNTAGAANGTHEVKVTVADRVGNQSETVWDVDVQHAPDEATRTLTSVRRTILGAALNDQAGSSVAAVGDMNGDGRADYLVGAPGVSEGGRTAAGAAYIVLGEQSDSTVDLANRPSTVKRILGPSSSSYCGASVAAAGDINADGRSDILVGCPGLNPAAGSLTTTTGRVYVAYGRANPQDLDLSNPGADAMAIVGPSDNAGLSLPLGTARAAVFGERLQSAPVEAAGGQDVNSDGYADIVIGDSAVPSRGLTASGAAYVIYGKASSTTVNVTDLGSDGYVIRGDRQYGLAGYAATIAGDLDGDLLAEVLVGSPGARDTDEGRAYVISGSASTTDIDLGAPARVRTLTSPETGDRFGVNVTALGDTNLDAQDDIAIATRSGAHVLRTIPSTNRQVTLQDGYRVTGPANAPGLGGLLPGLAATVPATTISAAGDLDGDERVDATVGYPDAAGARAYTIISPERARSLSVTALAGQRGAAISNGTQSDRSGASTSGNSYLIDAALTENAQVVVGAPLAAPSILKLQAGRAYIIGERPPSGPGSVPIPPDDPTEGVEEDSAAQARAILPGKYKVDGNGPGGYATVRAANRSLAIGNAAHRQTAFAVNVTGRESVYYFARFRGNLNFCGWIGAGELFTPGVAASGFSCPARPYKYKNFMGVVSCEDCINGPQVSLRGSVNANGVAVDRMGQPMPTSGTIPYYRNVRPLRGPKARPSPTQPSGTLPLGTVASPTRVKWRYHTKGGKFALIRVPDSLQLRGSDWVFIDARYLPFPVRGGLCGNPPGNTPLPIPNTRKDWPRQCQQTGYQVAPSN